MTSHTFQNTFSHFQWTPTNKPHQNPNLDLFSKITRLKLRRLKNVISGYLQNGMIGLRMWSTQYCTLQKQTVRIFLHVSCMHLMITLSHSYGTVGHNFQLEFTSPAHTPTERHTNLRTKYPGSSCEAKRNWPLLYTSK
jgi:hypothetical protein